MRAWAVAQGREPLLQQAERLQVASTGFGDRPVRDRPGFQVTAYDELARELAAVPVGERVTLEARLISWEHRDHAGVTKLSLRLIASRVVAVGQDAPEAAASRGLRLVGDGR